MTQGISEREKHVMTSGLRTGGRAYRVAIAFVVLLFFLWGMANNLNDILITQFKKAFALSDFGTSFVQQVFYFGYFLFSLPAALLMQGRGYRIAIMTGLGCYGVGALLFYPAAEFGRYEFFLVALFIIAGGLAFLETAANPLMTEIGDPAGAARRLNWAQVANPIGTLCGILVGKYFILSGKTLDPTDPDLTEAAKTLFYREEILSVRGPYIALGLIVLGLAVLAAFIRFPQGASHSDVGTSPVRIARLFRNPRLRFAVIAQFFYVGAQIGVWSYTIRYAEVNAHMTEAAGADALLASLVLFAFGRFCGTSLMARVRPNTMLQVFATFSFLLVFGASVFTGALGLYCLVVASFFLSIQFPTIFALGVEGLGSERRVGASLIIMAIIGGAFLTGVMGHASDLVGIRVAMLVPCLCFAVVLSFSLYIRHLDARRSGSGRLETGSFS
ncbi:L-fucose:H+ symporter permease [Swaminathania salitolerans]|uniref:L-fucose:H+ symporter permease n=1 Tax=Swaminathania salitolerans TaxID=182838 RepID=A0A511BTC4_9PROT|nr:L-fucose:H+ symporter permease [Swaminathania salitolerans]GBQ10229.1 L-fucose:H+ symporter permease [Swaminathania salitolerans LMG 21291]GEL01218.1 L-fucose:H+ symporter permease [Swaminathania salitolerans]